MSRIRLMARWPYTDVCNRNGFDKKPYGFKTTFTQLSSFLLKIV